MCNQFTFHHQFRIDARRSKFEQTTDSILSAFGSFGQRTTRILTRSTWKHRVLHNTCIKHGKRHHNTVCWVDINLALKKGLKFHQTRSKAIILQETLPAYCIPKVVRMETGEVLNEIERGRPFVCSERAPRSQEIERRSSREEDVNHDRTGRPGFCSQERLIHVSLGKARSQF